jgi:hypothetical protein
MSLELSRRQRDLQRTAEGSEKASPRLGGRFDVPGTIKSKFPDLISPQLATLVDEVPHGDE